MHPWIISNYTVPMTWRRKSHQYHLSPRGINSSRIYLSLLVGTLSWTQSLQLFVMSLQSISRLKYSLNWLSAPLHLSPTFVIFLLIVSLGPGAWAKRFQVPCSLDRIETEQKVPVKDLLRLVFADLDPQVGKRLLYLHMVYSACWNKDMGG